MKFIWWVRKSSSHYGTGQKAQRPFKNQMKKGVTNNYSRSSDQIYYWAVLLSKKWTEVWKRMARWLQTLRSPCQRYRRGTPPMFHHHEELKSVYASTSLYKTDHIDFLSKLNYFWIKILQIKYAEKSLKEWTPHFPSK